MCTKEGSGFDKSLVHEVVDVFLSNLIPIKFEFVACILETSSFTSRRVFELEYLTHFEFSKGFVLFLHPFLAQQHPTSAFTFHQSHITKPDMSSTPNH